MNDKIHSGLEKLRVPIDSLVENPDNPHECFWRWHNFTGWVALK